MNILKQLNAQKTGFIIGVIVTISLASIIAPTFTDTALAMTGDLPPKMKVGPDLPAVMETPPLDFGLARIMNLTFYDEGDTTWCDAQVKIGYVTTLNYADIVYLTTSDDKISNALVRVYYNNVLFRGEGHRIQSPEGMRQNPLGRPYYEIDVLTITEVEASNN